MFSVSGNLGIVNGNGLSPPSPRWTVICLTLPSKQETAAQSDTIWFPCYCIWKLLLTKLLLIRKKLSEGVLRKRCAENMQQIYRRTLMSKYHFNKVTLLLYWNRTSGLVFSQVLQDFPVLLKMGSTKKHFEGIFRSFRKTHLRTHSVVSDAKLLQRWVIVLFLTVWKCFDKSIRSFLEVWVIFWKNKSF